MTGKQGKPFGELSPLLAPHSVAVVGASDREGNLGGVAVGFLKKFGYAGPVWPVNPGRKTVADLPCFPSLRELPAVPDLAILAVPAESVAGALKDCAGAGVPAAVAWAGGFAEVGEEGRARQRQIEEACRAGGTPEEFGRLLADEVATWSKVIRTAKIQFD